MASHCPHEQLVFVRVPPALQTYAPDAATTIRHCPRCLAVIPGSDDQDSQPPTAAVSYYPTGDAGVGVILLLGLLDSFAHNRERIGSLIDELERRGVDVFGLLQRLIDDPEREPAIALERRLRHLEQTF